jgi:hypothetical protein
MIQKEYKSDEFTDRALHDDPPFFFFLNPLPHMPERSKTYLRITLKAINIEATRPNPFQAMKRKMLHGT